MNWTVFPFSRGALAALVLIPGASFMIGCMQDTNLTGSNGSTARAGVGDSSGGADGIGGNGGGAAGPMCGDNICNGAETSQDCPADCGAPVCAHDLCTVGEPLALGCDVCVDKICAFSPECCTNGWDSQCVSKAGGLCVACSGDGVCSGGENCTSHPEDCGTCPPPPTCPHPVCIAGGALNTTDCYDPCVQQTCAASQTCCGVGIPPAPTWTGECVALAKMTCGADPCVTAVCAQDPSCCTADWTQACVDLAKSACNVTCQCAHSICSAGNGTLDPACDPCAAQICLVDPYCCTTDWDVQCVSEVATICGAICP
jgi:hypothetical protein